MKQAKRRFIFERDQGICQICMKPVAVSALSIDHIVPRCLGGTDANRNLRLAHRFCNHWKNEYVDQPLALEIKTCVVLLACLMARNWL